MTIGKQPLCYLTDNLRPIPFRTGGERTPIFSVQQLVDALQGFAVQKPRVLILSTTKNGPTAFIGLSGELASVDLYPQPSTHRSWFPKPKTQYSFEDFWITSEGEPVRYPAWSMMPVADVIQIVAHIVEHDELPDAVEWVNLKGRRLFSLHEDTGTHFGPRLMSPP
jgi:immunity protein Imm1 of predicted polymorphic toxin system